MSVSNLWEWKLLKTRLLPRHAALSACQPPSASPTLAFQTILGRSFFELLFWEKEVNGLGHF